MSYDKVNHMTRNKGLDILRIICALMIVFIHTNNQSIYIRSICRIAVPIFFMISGYLYDSHKSLKKQIVRVLKILLIATASYFVIYFLLYGRNLEYAVELLDKFRNYGFINIVLFNVNPIFNRLWYLSAYLLVLLFMSIIGNRLKQEHKAALIIVLPVIGLMLGTYSPLIFGQRLPTYYCRNWLFVGIPYFLLGQQLKGRSQDKGRISLAIASLLFLLLEVYIYQYMGIKQKAEYYLFTPLLAIAVFNYFVSLKTNQKTLLFLSRLGREDSLNIYLNHKLIEIFSDFISYVSIYPVIVFALALLLSRLQNYCLRRISHG